MDAINISGDLITGPDYCAYFEKEFWFELVKSVWIKYRSNFQDSVKYINNDIVKQFKVSILKYTECVREIHDLAKYLPPPLMKGGDYNKAYWAFREK